MVVLTTASCYLCQSSEQGVPCEHFLVGKSLCVYFRTDFKCPTQASIGVSIFLDTEANSTGGLKTATRVTMGHLVTLATWYVTVFRSIASILAKKVMLTRALFKLS